jgi:hypothetical protein
MFRWIFDSLVIEIGDSVPKSAIFGQKDQNVVPTNMS